MPGKNSVLLLVVRQHIVKLKKILKIGGKQQERLYEDIGPIAVFTYYISSLKKPDLR